MERFADSETGTGSAGAKRILRPVGPQDSSLARRLSDFVRDAHFAQHDSKDAPYPKIHSLSAASRHPPHISKMILHRN
jgi:hypothetical protein